MDGYGEEALDITVDYLDLLGGNKVAVAGPAGSNAACRRAAVDRSNGNCVAAFTSPLRSGCRLHCFGRVHVSGIRSPSYASAMPARQRRVRRLVLQLVRHVREVRLPRRQLRGPPRSPPPG